MASTETNGAQVNGSPSKKQKTTDEASMLDQLREITTVVADTGELEMIKKYKPTDATTNPSLLNKASRMDEYKHLVDDALEYGKKYSCGTEQDKLDLVIDKLAVNFGCEILKIVPGYVSTEVDARLSYDVGGSLKRARRIIELYEKAGVSRDRILIKLASTWEGCQAAQQLQKEGISCNMTLLFCFEQAVAAANAGATLISPFVGRIMDWYSKAYGKTYSAEEDPGVKNVTEIYNYYKQNGFKTIVMGASFRNTGEIMELAGCDRLTISPQLLEELKSTNKPVVRKLDPKTAKSSRSKEGIDEQTFRFKVNDDPMAYEKLGEGIRKFSEDIRKLEDYLREKL
eukprot:gb/GECG01008404.1/.p1 GENE.gb/GECG01008404.1/~~gb/GECG01008404.1/.p1  ORF type:complete len:342 (+),score=62.35 gb/GECG01008404.1/:1-1026(+)